MYTKQCLYSGGINHTHKPGLIALNPNTLAALLSLGEALDRAKWQRRRTQPPGYGASWITLSFMSKQGEGCVCVCVFVQGVYV